MIKKFSALWVSPEFKNLILSKGKYGETHEQILRRLLK